jgi:hypothetical protein
MDLEENIRIAAEVYILRECEGVVPTSFDEVKDIYSAGAKSQAAKDYWYNEFKREQMTMRDKVSHKRTNKRK